MTIDGAHRTRAMVAKYLNIPQGKVNLKRSLLGGSFGGIVGSSHQVPGEDLLQPRKVHAREL